MQDYQNKVAVITGAASGMGKAIAEKCVQLQMKVVLADIDADRLFKFEQELKKRSAGVIAVKTDVSNEGDIKNLAKVALNTFGKVNLLFNHAGIPGPIGTIWEVDLAEFKHMLHCNLMSVVYGLREFIPQMLKQNDECHIVNTASGAGLQTEPNMSGYITSKHAVVALSEVLYFDLKKTNANINVSLLCPGLVATNFADSLEIKATDSADTKELINFFKTVMKEQGKPVSEIVDIIFKAIAAKQFYILPHLSEHYEGIKNRIENILQSKNPDSE